MSRRKPFDPSKQKRPIQFSEQLGAPNVHRAAKSKAGFELEQLALNAQRDGVVRSREKSMLTHPALLAERTNSKLRAYADQGKEPDQDIQIQQTPSDRATAMYRHLLWQHFYAHWDDTAGKSGGTNFEKSSHSSDLNKLPLTEGQFGRRRFYAWLRKQPGGRELSDFLNDVAAQCNPQAYPPGYKIMSKQEIGAWLLDADSIRDSKSAVDGALALACRILAGMSAQFAAQERHEALAKKKQAR